MTSPIRWGIIGTGSIAKQFARGLTAIPDAQLVAVGSRTAQSAEAFGNEFNVRNRHASYAALAADPDVDAVYIATPHPMHVHDTLLCLNAGKAVLCEKPFAVNASETKQMIELARAKKLFLMEAMWTRYIPVVVKAREWLKQGCIGEPRMVMCDFGFRAGWDETSRLIDPRLAGGGLLDVGVYAISFASMVYGGSPKHVSGHADLGSTGVDEQAGMVLSYGKDRMAVLACAVRTTTPQHAYILGSEGSIQIHAPFWKATVSTLNIDGKAPETIEIPHVGNGYNYEAEEVMRCMRAGKLESDVMPLDETLTIMETMDRLRELWRIKYPMD